MSSNLRLKKTCMFCGKEFTARTTKTQYCSHQCSARAYKQRTREERLKQFTNENEKIQQPFAKPTPTPIKEIMSTQELAELMGVTRTTIHRYCVSGTIPCMKINRKIFIRKRDVDHLFEAAGPYMVNPAEREPITEFYTLQEVVDKFKCSKSLVYTVVKNKHIPHLEFRGKTLYSQKHINKHMEHKLPDPSIKEWISIAEIMKRYDMTQTAVYGFVSDHKISKKVENNRAFYPKEQVENLLNNRLPDSSIKEWYAMADIERIYGLKQTYVSNLIYKNPIPKTKKGSKVFLSKVHFDKLIKDKDIVPEYYTVEEAMEKFQLSRDALYYHVKKNHVPKIQEGRYIKISKREVDNIFQQRPIIL